MLEYQGEYKISDNLDSDNKTLKYTWDFILNNIPKNLYSFNLSDEIFRLFENELITEMKNKVNKKFKTLDMIEK